MLVMLFSFLKKENYKIDVLAHANSCDHDCNQNVANSAAWYKTTLNDT